MRNFIHCVSCATVKCVSPQQCAVCLILVIQLTKHGHTTLDPVLRALAGGQLHRNNKIGGVACGGKGALPLTGLVKRTNIQLLRLVDALLLS